jgi:hypothetical protein
VALSAPGSQPGQRTPVRLLLVALRILEVLHKEAAVLRKGIVALHKEQVAVLRKGIAALHKEEVAVLHSPEALRREIAALRNHSVVRVARKDSAEAALHKDSVALCRTP